MIKAGDLTRGGGAPAARAVAIAVVAALVLVLGACSPSSTAPSARSSVLGVTVFASGARSRLPDVEATTLSGGRVALRDLVGHGLAVVNVWASWCTECRTESPALARLAGQLRGQGVVFVGIDEQDNVDKARAFARSTGMSYPHLVDADGSLLSKFTLLPSYGIPSTLVVDRHGDMAARIVGATNAAQLRSVIDQIGR